jgi:hypothetical protein
MPVVPEDQRLDVLRCLGLSEPLVRLSAGESVDPLFEYRCQGPPWYCYHGAHTPAGPPFAPLWDCCNSVTGVWEKDGRLEFLEFSIEDRDDEYTVLAHTEQGLWATVFADLYEDRDKMVPAEFMAPARLVGFRFVDRVVVRDEGAVATFEGRHEWLRKVVATMEHDSAGEVQ